MTMTGFNHSATGREFRTVRSRQRRFSEGEVATGWDNR
jgi:hypothetical protein